MNIDFFQHFIFGQAKLLSGMVQSGLAAGLVVLATMTAAQAQLVAAPAASAPISDDDAMERAKRQANNVMRWIKVHADKPRAPATPPPAPAPAPRPPAKQQAAPSERPQPSPAVIAVAEPPVVAPPVVEPPAPVAPVVAPAVAMPLPAAAPPKAPVAPPEEEDERPLKALSQAQPVLSRSSQAAINVGKAMVRFTVETNGTVSNVSIVSSSSRLLNNPTISAVSSWRFEPIKVPRVAQVEIEFNP